MTNNKTGYIIQITTFWDMEGCILNYKINTKKIALDRAKLGLSISELSAISEVGRSTISRIERGVGKNRLDTVARVAKALGRDVEAYLID